MHQNISCAGTYSRLEGPRNIYMERARECAGLTIPSLLMEEGHNSDTRLVTPYQSIGARGVNNLASKLMMALFPPNTPFFKLSVDDFTLAELTGGDDTQRAAVDESLATIERAVISELEGEGMRNTLHECIRHLIVTGNYLLTLPQEGNLKGFGLERYVVSRDPQGRLKHAIIKEQFAPDTLDPEILQYIGHIDSLDQPTSSEAKVIDVYTKYMIGMNDSGKKRWITYQEINGMQIPGTYGEYDIETPPIMSLRWTAVTGESYGRSHVEEVFGDLRSLEGLHKAILDGSAASARLLVMVNPNGTTKKQAVASAANGAVVTGKASDVEMLQVNKASDLSVAGQTAQRIEQRLAQAFVMESSVIRQAERVSAEEVRLMATMLEGQLSGTYGALSSDLQKPLVSRLMSRMQQQKKLPKLPEGVVKPHIVSGLEALGRGHDLTKYAQMMQMLAPVGPEALAMVNVGDLVKRIATSLGIDADGLIKSPEQIQAEQQQAMESQMTQMVAQGGMDMLKNQQQQQQE